MRLLAPSQTKKFINFILAAYLKDTTLERARWRCRRGLLELDIVLQRFMDQHYAQLDEAELRQFDSLLDLPDNDLWDMITARKEAEDKSLQPVLRLLQKS